jgi:hypothetical protein
MDLDTKKSVMIVQAEDRGPLYQLEYCSEIVIKHEKLGELSKLAFFQQ